MALPRIGFIGCGPFSTGSIYPCLQALAFGLAPDAGLELAVRGDRAHVAGEATQREHAGPRAELVACCDQ